MGDLLLAATETISIYDLARKITDMFSLEPIISDIDDSLPENNYSCNTSIFRQKLHKYNIGISSLEKQIMDTYLSL